MVRAYGVDCQSIFVYYGFPRTFISERNIQCHAFVIDCLLRYGRENKKQTNKMFKSIKTMTLLLAATTLLAVSCGKDDTEPEANGGGSAGGTATPAITESSIIGTWGYKSTHALTGNELVIKGDHTVTFDGKTYNWTLTDNQFVANAGNYFKIEFTINAINAKSMDISGGSKRYNGSSQEWYIEKNMTGTVVKTVTEVLSSLPDDLVVGDWVFSGTLGSGWPLQVSDDHTCIWNYNYTSNWNTEGPVFKARGTGNFPRFKMKFTVDSVTTSATNAIMYVTGDYRDSVYRISGWEETGDELVGMFTKSF